MSDMALAQLLALQFDEARTTLLVLDENASQLPPNTSALARVVTNRIDIANSAVAQNWPCDFCDFEFDRLIDFTPESVLYRISKEKRVVEHILQSSWNLLGINGELCIAGFKNEGIKTFAKRAEQAWKCTVTLQRGDANLHLYRFVKTAEQAAPLNDESYHNLQEIGQWQELRVNSKPGVFAWNRFDEGSQFLLQHLDTFLRQSDYSRQSVLDLGCGYGLLAMALHQAGCARIVATDNNAAAIRACQYNFAQYGIAGDVIAADCAEGITGRFDLVVCNPPFHQGFDVEQDLTDRFLLATRRLLTKNGRALFVVNSFIPLERKAKPMFGSIGVVADNKRFKLVQLGL